MESGVLGLKIPEFNSRNLESKFQLQGVHKQSSSWNPQTTVWNSQSKPYMGRNVVWTRVDTGSCVSRYPTSIKHFSKLVF